MNRSEIHEGKERQHIRSALMKKTYTHFYKWLRFIVHFKSIQVLTYFHIFLSSSLFAYSYNHYVVHTYLKYFLAYVDLYHAIL